MRLTVLIPTRGVVFTRSIQSLLGQLPQDTKYIFTEGMNIPDAQNYLVDAGLKTDAEAFLMVEEDNVVPNGAVEAMCAILGDIVCIDYPVANGYSTIMKKDGEIHWCGLGCTLVYRRVFEALDKPIFRTDQSLLITNLETYDYELQDIPNKYGGHDILFGYYARQKGFKISQAVGFESPHLRAGFIGHNENNNGFHGVYELPRVSKRQEYRSVV